METPASDTTTIAASDEKKNRAPSTHSQDNGEAPNAIIPPSHDPNFGDLSFPFQSTNIAEGGFTDEDLVNQMMTFLLAGQSSLIHHRPNPFIY